MKAESLIRLCYYIDKSTSHSRDLTNCFKMTRAYLRYMFSMYRLNIAKIIDNPRSFSYDKDIYHVEIFDKNTSGHSFLLVRCRDTNKYKLVQSFQGYYKLRVETKYYSPKEVYQLLKQIASIRTYSKEAVNLIRNISKLNIFEFSCRQGECADCGYIYKKTRLYVIINEYNCNPTKNLLELDIFSDL